MRNNCFLRLVLVALTWLAASCTPRYYVSLQPAHSTNLFVEGQEQARAFTADSVEVRMSFVCFEASRMVFEAVYRNPMRGRQLVVTPEIFGYRPSRAGSAALAADARRPHIARGQQVTATVAAASAAAPLPPLPSVPIPAFDPEPEIRSLQATAEREDAKANRVDWLGAALAITSVVVDVSSIGKRESQAHAQSRDALHNGVVAYQIASTAAHIEHTVAAEALHLRALNLQDFALRTVTLEPGQQVRGYLYFPRFDAADAVQVLAPVPGGTLPLEFVQTHTRR